MEKLILEAGNEALESVLGHSGSDMICRYTLQIGVERGEIPSNLGTFRRMLRELMTSVPTILKGASSGGYTAS